MDGDEQEPDSIQMEHFHTKADQDEMKIRIAQTAEVEQGHSEQRQDMTTQLNELQAFREEVNCQLASMESRVASVESSIDEFWRIDRKTMQAWILGSGC
jgi:uncharacterized coiled-coil DUF342 family protein